MSKVIIYNQGELVALVAGLSTKAEYPIKISYSFGLSRSLSQNALSHCIYSELSKYLIQKGRTDCSPDWIKRMLKNRLLGWIDETYTDIVTGQKTTRQELRHTSSLDKGEMMDYLTQIIEWSSSIGLEIKIPVNSTYFKLMESQNE